MNPMSCLRLLPVFLALPVSLPNVHAQEPPDNMIDRFTEKFALSDDRAAVLKELIPGTVEWYYWHALHYQNTGAREEFEKTIAEWTERFPDPDPRRETLQNRQALLDYGENPQRTLDWIREKGGLFFNHQPENPETPPEYPSALDQTLISWDAFWNVNKQAGNNPLENVTDAGLRALLERGPVEDPARRRAILARLKRPDLPRVVDLVLADLGTKESRGFGEFEIHRALLLEQLKTLAEKRPELLQNETFVLAWLARLAPPAGADPERDPKVEEAWLQRMEEFILPLTPAFNSLKAHVLYHRLLHDLSQGVYNAERLVAYLKLPRPVIYASETFRRDREVWRHEVDLNAAQYTAVTKRPPIHNDESVVRRALLRLLAENPDNAALFAPYVREEWLNHLLAEAQLTEGAGDPDKYVSLLPPGAYQELLVRQDLEFDPANPDTLPPGGEARVSVWTKNIPRLTVKVYEINTENVHLSTGRPVNTDLDLDGLTPNHEFSFDYNDPPVRRVKREISLGDALRGRGVWMVEFIGGGKSSRALLRRGDLHVLSRATDAGTLLTILDEAGKPVPRAYARIGAQRFEADEAGRALIPFSTEPGEKPVIVGDGQGFTVLERINVAGENYALKTGAHVPREALLPGATAPVVLRPVLLSNGTPVALNALENVKLTITAQTTDNTPTSTEIPLKDLPNDREITASFTVPERLRTLTLTLAGEVKSLVTGRPAPVSASHSLQVNGVSSTTITRDIHLERAEDGWTLRLLGRNGEPKAGQGVNVSLTHRDFTRPVDTTLRADENGAVRLGALEGVVTLKASAPGAPERSFDLPRDDASFSETVHLAAGETLRLPWPWTAEDPLKGALSVLETREGQFVRSVTDGISLKDGAVVVQGLAEGEYSVFLHPVNRALTVRVAAGAVTDGWLLSPSRVLELSNPSPLAIGNLERAGVAPEPGKEPVEALRIPVAGAGPDTRVHVFVSRLLPEFDAFAALGDDSLPEPEGRVPAWRPSIYQSARVIGEEYRYVLERRRLKHFAGNLLAKPGLLLNPWAISDTKTETREAEQGEAPAPAAPETAAKLMGRRERADATGAMGGVRAPEGAPSRDLSFLARQGAAAVNLKPDANGFVTVNAAAIGHGQFVRVVAVSSDSAAVRNFALPAVPLQTRDLRLSATLDATKRHSRQDQVTILEKDAPFTLSDASGAEARLYGNLTDVWGVLRAINGNTALGEFDFLRTWPSFDEAKKRELYSRHACHELNFFLSRKDPAFFESVVRPFLENKRDKTFMDHYLTGADLSGYLNVWKWGRLNVVERVLLARRLETQREAAVREIRDWLETRPKNPERERFLFETALLGAALDGSTFNFDAGAAHLDALKAEEMRFLAPPVPAPAAAPMTEAAVDGPALLRRAPAPAQRGLGMRKAQEAFFRQADKTKEWAENNYWKLPIAEQTASLVTANPFWLDYALWDGKTPFLSGHFPAASSNFTEMMLALAVLDLPFEGQSPAPKSERKDGALVLTSATRAVLFHREIKPSEPDDAAAPPAVNRNFFRDAERKTEQNGELTDKFVTDEFVAGEVYGCQVTVTNPASTPRRLEVLFQIPRGSIPVGGTRSIQSVPVTLEGFAVQNLEFRFYFPQAGEYEHWPVHVTREGKTAAFTEGFTFKVVDKPGAEDTESWDYVSQRADAAKVLAFLEKANLFRVDLERVAWRLKDAEFFKKLTALLRARKFYHHTVWSYAVEHNDRMALREFLEHSENLLTQCGPALESPLVTIDPVERHAWQWLEYSPLINARAHRLGDERRILNDKFRAQYAAFLNILTFRPSLTAEDRLGVVWALTAQDRLEEALEVFAKVDASRVAEKIQYDYLRAWLAMSVEDTATARSVAAAHAGHPVNRWRDKFAELQTQLDEIDGKASGRPRPEDREAQQDALAATAPQFDFTIEGGEIRLNTRNVTEVTLNYYPMDLEFLFSANPFVSQDTARFRMIRPNKTERRALPAGVERHALPLPQEYRNANVLVEITAAGVERSAVSYANALDVQISENHGILTVRHTGDRRPLPRTYVKVFAERDGRPVFYKDGYTDLRGKFDYASLSTDDLDNTTRFAILILHPEHGAVVREVKPPQR